MTKNKAITLEFQKEMLAKVKEELVKESPDLEKIACILVVVQESQLELGEELLNGNYVNTINSDIR